MELRAGSQTILEPNATARMSEGDTLSLAITFETGRTELVTIMIGPRAATIIQRGAGIMFIQPTGA